MSYIDVHNLSENGEFKVRLAAALVNYVQVIFNEAADVEAHAQRLDLAVKVLNAPKMYADRISLAAAAQFQGVAPDDASLDALVAAYWTKIAVAPQSP